MLGEGLVCIDSDYEYVLGTAMGNVLNLQADFSSLDWATNDIRLIAKELENTARLFATKQGLGTQVVESSINGNQVLINKKGRTGNLLNSIHANVIERSQEKYIDFYNNAQNDRGQFYAGHIEYGFKMRDGRPYPARPFMRPALHAVAEASRGNLQGALYHFLQQNLINLSATQLSFGSPIRPSGGTRAFYNQSITGRGAPKSGFYTTKGLVNGKMNAQRHWQGISGMNNKGHYSHSFIGKGNNRVFGQGNKNTYSTQKYRDNTKTSGNKGLKSYSNTKKEYLTSGKSASSKPVSSSKTSSSKSIFPNGKVIKGVDYENFGTYHRDMGGDKWTNKKEWDRH